MVAPLAFTARAAESPLFKLLKSGRLPAERTANVVEYLCKSGGPEELAYIYERSVAADCYTGSLRVLALDRLAQAAEQRSVVPQVDAAGLKRLIDPSAKDEDIDAATRLAAIRLAGAWKTASVAGELTATATAEKLPLSQRSAALAALSRLGSDAATMAIEQLITADRPAADQYLGLIALARFDTEAAAKKSAPLLAAGGTAEQVAELVDAFLGKQGGADALAQALAGAASAGKPLPKDTARRALQHMYAIGRTDAALADVLGKAAGIGTEVKLPEPEELKRLAARVEARGDAARGERVFRRSDLNCTKCHSINGAGGQVGPDLIGLGGASPVDYLIESIMVPEKAVKEEYVLASVITEDGLPLQGILKEESPERVVLRGADGAEHVVTGDFEDLTKGGSLMPKGLTNFMTQDELLDLVRFLYDLGRPGGQYERNTAPIFRTWRALIPKSGPLTEGVPDAEVFAAQLLAADKSRDWRTVFSMVSGAVPLDELVDAKSPGVVYLQTDVEVKSGGQVGFQLDSADGLGVWIDDQPVSPAEKMTTGLTPGRHTVTLRVDPAQRKQSAVTLQLFPPADSTAEAQVAGGR